MSRLAAASGADERALRASLERVERFVDDLEARHEAVRQRQVSGVARARAALPTEPEVEDLWADYLTARRLRDTIAAAVANAEARVALIEAETSATIGAAFAQFREDRRRRHAGRKRSRRSVARPKAPAELAEMAANAKMATVHVICDRNRLTARLVDLRFEAEALRAQLGAGTCLEPEERASLQQRLAFCEEHAAYFEQQVLASTKIVRQLLTGLRALIQGLPRAVAALLAQLEVQQRRGEESN